VSAGRTTVHDCTIIDLPRIVRPEGSITFVESGGHVPFELQRVYYLYDIPGDQFRGGHAHRELQQLFVSCLGAFDVVLDDGTSRRTVTLNRSYYGLYVPAGIWRELENFSSGSVCLVLASLPYDESEYIRDRAEFVRLKPTL
jgi:dTDP-4-dehydrorhamnose 3,5-epimerase-like enzyme